MNKVNKKKLGNKITSLRKCRAKMVILFGFYTLMMAMLIMIIVVVTMVIIIM